MCYQPLSPPLRSSHVKIKGHQTMIPHRLPPYKPIGEAVVRRQLSLFCFNHCVPDTVHGSCPAGGGCPCGLIHSVSLLSSHGSLHVAGALIAFKCLTRAYTILVGDVVWGLPRCVWARESTAPVQGNRSLSRELRWECKVQKCVQHQIEN